jgi:predicted alpha-1,2-mannosidase
MMTAGWTRCLTAALLTTAFLVPAAHADTPVADPAALVDTFVGTTGDGHDFPGADTPFGMMQWSPDTPSRPKGGGYQYNDSSITGFSLTHISGPGCVAADDVPFLPTTGAISNPGSTTASFTHAKETAAPGYYSVGLGSGTRAELTTATRAGIGRFTYPAGAQANMIVKVADNPSPVAASTVTVVGDNTITGSVTGVGFCEANNPFTLYFSATFDHPFTASGSYNGGEYVTFDTSTSQVVQARVGISYVSVANARSNVDAEIPDWNFDGTRASAYQAWNARLGRIRVGGGTAGQQHVFYTALYHSLMHPNVFSDVNGQYLGFDNAVHTAPAGHAHYANYSGWDIYRTQAQLSALVAPDAASDMAQSMVDDYRQGGTLPKWAMNNAETYIMVGDPADAVLADYYAFGARDFDTSAALAAMVHQATVANNARPGGGYLDSFGYLPTDSPYGCCHYYAGVSSQLEYDTADFALSAYAAALGDTADAAKFRDRAQNWRNIFNPSSGYLQPRHSNGRWMTGFLAAPISGGTNSNDFAEGDSLIYTGMVPFNIAGLTAAKGGNAAMAKYLDGVLTGYTGLLSLAGLQSNMGNEPSFELPWEYDYIGQPHRTQQVVRQIQDQIWSDSPGGLAGNDDLGAMSAWYVWSALGMYPETPGTADLALGSPLFTTAAITLPGGHTLTINAPQAADNAPYVQSLALNGNSWNNAYLPASVISAGGTLDYTLGTSANTSWASAPSAAPPSYDGTATSGPVEPTGPVRSSLAGNCIDVANASNANGTAVQLYPCNGSNAQTWTVVPDGTLQALTKCLDVTQGGTANGTRVQLYVCNGTASQQWQSTSDGQLVNPRSGRCLTDPANSTAAKTRLEIDDCQRAAGQLWGLPN